MRLKRMLILLVLLWVPFVNNRKIVTTCEYDYLDEPCPSDNCLSNAPILSSGFDITDSTYKSNVLGLKWGTSCYYNPYNNVCYTTPAGVTVIPLSESDDITGTFIMHNTTETEQFQSDMMVDNRDYIIGMSSHTVDTYQSITSQYQQASQVGYVYYYYAFYAVMTPYNEQILDPDTYNIIMQLPEEYNEDMYFQFIQSYGTHYITESKWGLKYKFLSSFKSCMINTKSDSYVYDQVTTDGWIHSSEHTTYSGSSSTDSYYSSRRYTSESFEGGNISYHSSDQWNNWVLSGENMIDLVPVALRLNPIYMIINDTVRQNNMKQAYYNYINMKHDQQALIIEQKKLGPRSVSYAAFDIHAGSMVPYFYIGSVGSTNIQMAANQSSTVFGKSGSCNGLSHYAYLSDEYYEVLCPSSNIECYNYNCITQFLCQRNENGDIRVQHYFDANGWKNSVKTKSDCVNTYLIANNTDTERSYKYDFDRVNYNTYYGEQIAEPYTNTNHKNTYDLYYNEDRAVFNTGHVIAYDDKYEQNKLMSITAFSKVQPACGGYGVCYMDCDYITINVDLYGYPVVSCNC